MTIINVEFSDSSESEIIAFFSCAQDKGIYPNQAQLDSNDARWKAFYSLQPQSVQQFLPVP